MALPSTNTSADKQGSSPRMCEYMARIANAPRAACAGEGHSHRSGKAAMVHRRNPLATTARARSSTLIAELRHHIKTKTAADATVRAAGVATGVAAPAPVAHPARGAAPPARVRIAAAAPVAHQTRGVAPPAGTRISTPSTTTTTAAAHQQHPPRNGAPHRVQLPTSCEELLLPPPYSSPALPQTLVLMLLPSQELLPSGLVSL